MAKKAKPGPTTVVTPAEVVEEANPDLQLVTTDGSQIQTFIGNLVTFFRGAREIEMAAKARLVKANELKAKPPATEEADIEVQTFIKTVRADKKTAEEYWGICQVFSSVHRRLTAARGRSTDTLDQAGAIAQKLHNDYAEAARRAAAAEQERKRLADEAIAQAARDKELADMEAEAVKREEAMQDLSDREQAFVTYYVTGYDTKSNGQLSADRAGFKDAFKSAARLLSLPKIQAAIKAKSEAELIRTQRAAVAEKPLDVQTEDVRPAIGRPIGGGHDRSTHSGEVLDVNKLMAAFLAGGHGIPQDIWTVDQPKLNEYAKSLQARLNLWPGVRYVKNTTTV